MVAPASSPQQSAALAHSVRCVSGAPDGDPALYHKRLTPFTGLLGAPPR
ncbi:hypothetical protein [Alcaligenes sp. CHO6]|jgi:hypothetical protein|nr:hypothetical protein QEZ63_12725 [Alcaligenes faecalis]HRK87125.1 hypothetical protein [Alcaligenes faecalis]